MEMERRKMYTNLSKFVFRIYKGYFSDQNRLRPELAPTYSHV